MKKKKILNLIGTAPAIMQSSRSVRHEELRDVRGGQSSPGGVGYSNPVPVVGN